MLVLEYKAKPNNKQVQAIEEAIRTAQFVRNSCLRYWMDNSSKEIPIGKKELFRYNTKLRADYQFVNQLNSHACQASVERTWLAISRFFANCKAKKSRKRGYPKFKRNSRSVEYKTSGWKLHSSKRRIKFTDQKGIGELKLLGKWDVHTLPTKSIKRVRIVRRADGYYVQFCVDLEESFPENNNSGMIGLDLGLEYFYSDSNENQVDNPRFLRQAEKAIKSCQRKIYSKRKGSNNRKKASIRYARKHLKVQRQREEFCKRETRNLCLANARVVIEDLNVAGLVRNHKLAKSIYDASWSTFTRWLEYFGEKLGCEIIKVSPHFTSQICSKCGEKTKKSLSQRTHKCQHCGHIENRDINAAKVILRRGIDQLPEGIREVTLRETFTSTNFSESSILASDV